MAFRNKIFISFGLLCLLALKSSDGDGIRLPDQQEQPKQQQNFIPEHEAATAQHIEGRRQGKGLLDLVGLGTGPNVDPYVAQTNANCLQGQLSECFKTQALGTFEEFFLRDAYDLTENARVVRVPQEQVRSLYNEPFEFSSEPRSTDSEWDQLVKYGLRKIERFVKSTAFEVNIPSEILGEGRYSPRFIDEIDSEIDTIEDKKAPLFTRKKLKRLFIPLLLVLKIFKLKLLLFLPFILGLAGLKKVLGLAAIIVPGLIAYFKICRPQNNLGSFGNYYSNTFSQYSPEGIGPASYHSHHHEHYPGGQGNFFRQEQNTPYVDYYSKAGAGNTVRWGENVQDLAYQGYSEYRNKKES
ncbi:uncharacterized protein LOC119652967 [Hermetia illucens]|nr:uncharacterized protein LOC119652967 [Hermetia illucens]XP_037913295.1 uncharacterized protein LOC119652967 [Hermetia illucens]XP_037913296.1 uncharacterized protein LOC119652967 [Hermetia illucens]